ncbi:MAG: hypothetical protein FIB07_10035 [Candidatus Methanoperedens sp.]|nr:hypothetical protein [Candidatus Methanoperedens sp.]
MKNIYYICGHFTDLVEYHELCSFFQKFFPEVKQHLMLVEHPYFSLVNYRKFLEGFDSVIRLPVCECAYTNRWYYELLPWIIFKRFIDVKAFLNEEKKISFQDDSLCIISEMTEATLSVRLLLRKFRTETIHSVICRIGPCYHRSLECDTNSWLSWLLHNKYILIGAYPVSVYLYGWMVVERRYYQERNIIDCFLVFSKKFEKHDDYIEIKYPLIENKQFETQQKRFVFFFDDGLGWTSLFSNISREKWIATMNQILHALTDLYRDENVVLLLKAHPAENGNIPYDLAGFEIYNKNETSEMIYSMRKEEIRAVYSVASTSSRSASLYGIDSYVFYEMFDFPEKVMARHKRYLLDFSNVVSIRNLNLLQKPELKNYSLPTTNKDLEQLAQLFRELNKR